MSSYLKYIPVVLFLKVENIHKKEVKSHFESAWLWKNNQFKSHILVLHNKLLNAYV